MSNKPLGRIAYETYCKASGDRWAISWPKLPDDIRAAWESTARACIPKLKWKFSDDPMVQKWTAETKFGDLTVERGLVDDDDGKFGEWVWGYCFAEYKDESYSSCKSAAEGKRLAEEEWARRFS